jgi:transcriptional regulator with XRE-family HTH domain
MIKKEMIENFGLTRKTLNNWENDKNTPRYILYKTLEALPIDFVKNIKKQEEDKAKNEELLSTEDENER